MFTIHKVSAYFLMCLRLGLNNTQSMEAQFQVPEDGVYVFEVTVIADGNGATPLVLFHNDTEVSSGSASITLVLVMAILLVVEL